jgi:hypothetical protein
MTAKSYRSPAAFKEALDARLKASRVARCVRRREWACNSPGVT